MLPTFLCRSAIYRHFFRGDAISCAKTERRDGMKRKLHIFLLKRRYVLVLAVLAVAAGIFYAVSYPAAQAAYATDRQLPIYCVDCGEEKRCAISFDAAWGDVRVR